MGKRDRTVRAGPPKIIEAAVALVVPPASREHVLGDLQERYAGTRNYLADALSAVPGSIAGRLLRVDRLLLAIEAGALYLSFLTAAWAALGAAYLCQHGDFLRLLLPAALAVAELVTGDVYDAGEWRTPLISAGMAVGCAAAVTGAHAPLRWPVLASGGILAFVLLSTLRVWFPSGGNRPRGEVL